MEKIENQFEEATEVTQVEDVTSVASINISDQASSENFDEVLQLTEYAGSLTTTPTYDFVVAEYKQVDTDNIFKKQSKTAEKFVSKITKFVKEFNDVTLSNDHKHYIEEVGKLQLRDLADLLSLIEINKQMIENIVSRMNATQAEDYAAVAAYNQLVNQHIKLIKDTSNLYKSIPSTMKKMRADVLTNQELGEVDIQNNELITEAYGETQFNNSKQMLKALLERRRQNKNIAEA